MMTVEIGRNGRAMLVAALMGCVPLGVAAQAAAPDGNAPDVVRSVDGRVQAPAPWAAGDPGDSLYREARQALNQGEFRRAAELFAELRASYPESEYVADTYYFEAFARYRVGSRAELNRAGSLLATQAERHADAATLSEAESLKLRIGGALASIGDAGAYREISQQAAQECDPEQQDLKSMALSALMQVDAERAAPILRDVLSERSACSAELRAQAVFILSQKMDDDLVDLVIDLAVGNPDPSSEVREAAVFALTHVEGERAEAALEQLLTTSGDPEIQEQAVSALAQRGSARAWEIVRDYALRPDVDPEVRQTAIFWVGQRGDGAFEFLDQVFQAASDEDTRESVVFAMTQTGDARVQSWLMARARDTTVDLEARSNALFWYAQDRDDVDVAELRALYGQVAEEELKEAVLFALTQRHDDPASVDALLAIARTEQDPDVLEHLMHLLGQSDDPRVVDFLLEIIRR